MVSSQQNKSETDLWRQYRVVNIYTLVFLLEMLICKIDYKKKTHSKKITGSEILWAHIDNTCNEYKYQNWCYPVSLSYCRRYFSTNIQCKTTKYCRIFMKIFYKMLCKIFMKVFYHINCARERYSPVSQLCPEYVWGSS